ncbi:hypothetical protein ABH310_09850 [Chromobacterium piscinae]
MKPIRAISADSALRADAAVDEGERQREQAAHGGAEHADADEQADAGLDAAADQFRHFIVLVSAAFCHFHFFFEGDRAFDLGLADDLGEAESQQTGQKARDHAADQKTSHHVRRLLSGRGSPAGGGRHGRIRAHTCC